MMNIHYLKTMEKKTIQNWTISIEIESPDGVTNSRLTRVISRALSDSNYFYNEISASSVSATLNFEKTVSTETEEEKNNQMKKIKKLIKAEKMALKEVVNK